MSTGWGAQQQVGSCWNVLRWRRIYWFPPLGVFRRACGGELWQRFKNQVDFIPVRKFACSVRREHLCEGTLTTFWPSWKLPSLLWTQKSVIWSPYPPGAQARYCQVLLLSLVHAPQFCCLSIFPVGTLVLASEAKPSCSLTFPQSWLGDVERTMRVTLRDLLRNCRVALKKFLNKRDKWVKDWAGQVSLGQ